MIGADGWLEWSTRRYGPPTKLYAVRNASTGIALHSMEGSYAGSMAVLDNPARAASWMFSLRLTGELVQHYSVLDSPWASGNAAANCALWSLELEGTAAMPINTAQIATALRLFEAFGAYTGRPARRPGNIYEHREVWNWSTPNAGATACPSERYAPLYQAMGGNDEMALIDEVIAALGGIDEIRRWNGTTSAPTGNSLLIGYALEQRRLRELEAVVHSHVTNHAGAVSAVPEHTHEPGAVTRGGN